MSEMDLIGMANAILRTRDKVNALLQENLLLKTRVTELETQVTQLTLKLQDAQDFAIEAQERSGQ